MNFLPVITRELQAQARQLFTYTLRICGVAALLLTMVILMIGGNLGGDDGAQLFVKLHRVVLVSICILVPLGTADCLSRERREGTLGLLFLTPLTARDIVLAKAIAHVLRALTLWLVSLPVQMLPILLGGVTWEHVAFGCLLNFWVISFVVGVSLVASALCQRAPRALGLTAALGGALSLILAYVLSLLIALAFCLFMETFAPATWSKNQWDWPAEWWAMARSPATSIGACFTFILGGDGLWNQILRIPSAAMRHAALAALGIGSLFALGVSWGLLRLAAHLVKRRWQDAIRSARVERLEKTFCQPVIAPGFLKRWLRRRLDRNPIGWLEQRSWSGRLMTWAWFAIIVSLYSFMLTDRNFFRGMGGLHQLMGWLLALSMAVSATGSFRRERESGVLELLLVSPLTTWELIRGRVRGLWGQFLPSLILYLGIWAYLISIFRYNYAGYGNDGGGLDDVGFFAVSFLVIPVVGLYFSVHCRNFIGALLLTLGAGFAVPAALALLARGLQWLFDPGNSYFDWGWGQTASVCLFQLLIAGGLLLKLHAKLEQRTFPLEQGLA